MAFEPRFTADESLEEIIQEKFSKKSELALVLTDQTAWWPGKRFFALTDAVTTERVPIHLIERIQATPVSPWLSMISGLCLALLGGTMLAYDFYSQFERPAKIDAPQMLRESLTLLVLGIALMLCGRWRWRILVRVRPGSSVKSFRWKSPLAVDRDTQGRVDVAVQVLCSWGERHGVTISFKRPRRLLPRFVRLGAVVEGRPCRSAEMPVPPADPGIPSAYRPLGLNSAPEVLRETFPIPGHWMKMRLPLGLIITAIPLLLPLWLIPEFTREQWMDFLPGWVGGIALWGGAFTYRRYRTRVRARRWYDRVRQVYFYGELCPGIVVQLEPPRVALLVQKGSARERLNSSGELFLTKCPELVAQRYFLPTFGQRVAMVVAPVVVDHNRNLPGERRGNTCLLAAAGCGTLNECERATAEIPEGEWLSLERQLGIEAGAGIGVN